MNTKRIASLLHYDWMLHNHTLKLTGIVIGIIYLCLALLYFVIKSELGFDGSHSESLPQVIGFFCHGYFSYATMAAMLVTTTLLTEKFCYPRTATAYLTLPGTSVEKFIVMLAEYAIAYIAMQIFFIVMFYVTMAICAINAPELNWMQNVFSYFDPYKESDIVQGILDSIKATSANDIQTMATQEGAQGVLARSILNMTNASIWMSPFASIAYLAYYMILNMFFKSNVQIKAIACIFLTYFAFMVALMIFIFGIIGAGIVSKDMREEIMFGKMETLFSCVTAFLYTTPAIAAGLLYFFYKQICRKQAK